MTYINDPGTDANSYSDAAARAWRTTAGLWKTDAKDNSGGGHPTGYVAGQLWSVTTTQYLNGLTDTLTTVSLTTLTWDAHLGSGSSSTFTLTIPKTGHYQVDVYLVFSETDNAFGSQFTCTVGGTAGLSNSVQMTQGNNNGTHTMGYGYAAHGTFTSGQTVTFQVSAAAWNLGSVTAGQINAHWVPTTANPV